MTGSHFPFHCPSVQNAGCGYSGTENLLMKNLRPETLDILQRIETLSGRPVEFKPDATLTLRATLQFARNGAIYGVRRLASGV